MGTGDVPRAKASARAMELTGAIYTGLLEKDVPLAFTEAAEAVKSIKPDLSKRFEEARGTLGELAKEFDAIDADFRSNLQASLKDATALEARMRVQPILFLAQVQYAHAAERVIVQLDRAFETPDYGAYRMDAQSRKELRDISVDPDDELAMLMYNRQLLLTSVAQFGANEADENRAVVSGPTVEELTAMRIASGIAPTKIGPKIPKTPSNNGDEGDSSDDDAAAADQIDRFKGDKAGFELFIAQTKLALDLGLPEITDRESYPDFLQALLKRSTMNEIWTTGAKALTQTIKMAVNYNRGWLLPLEFRDIFRFHVFRNAIDAAFKNPTYAEQTRLTGTILAIRQRYEDTITVLLKEAEQDGLGLADIQTDSIYQGMFRRTADAAIGEIIRCDKQFDTAINAIGFCDFAGWGLDILNALEIHGFIAEVFPGWLPVVEQDQQWLVTMARMVGGFDQRPLNTDGTPMLMFADIKALLRPHRAALTQFVDKLTDPAITFQDGIPGYASFIQRDIKGKVFTEPQFTKISINSTITQTIMQNKNIQEVFKLGSNPTVETFAKQFISVSQNALCQISVYASAFNPLRTTTELGWLQFLGASRSTVFHTTLAMGVSGATLFAAGTFRNALLGDTNIVPFLTAGAIVSVAAYRSAMISSLMWRSAGIISAEFESLSFDPIESTFGLLKKHKIPDNRSFNQLTPDEQMARVKDNPLAALTVFQRRKFSRFLYKTSRGWTNKMVRGSIGFVLNLTSSDMLETSVDLREHAKASYWNDNRSNGLVSATNLQLMQMLVMAEIGLFGILVGGTFVNTGYNFAATLQAESDKISYGVVMGAMALGAQSNWIASHVGIGGSLLASFASAWYNPMPTGRYVGLIGTGTILALKILPRVLPNFLRTALVGATDDDDTSSSRSKRRNSGVLVPVAAGHGMKGWVLDKFFATTKVTVTSLLGLTMMLFLFYYYDMLSQLLEPALWTWGKFTLPGIKAHKITALGAGEHTNALAYAASITKRHIARPHLQLLSKNFLY
jgi:hypothetical protein